MKTSKLACILIALMFSLTSQAQDLSDIIFGENNKSDYIGQYNYNGKRKNGFGIERYKNGSIYIGDFVEDEVSGRGMLISQKAGISNVKGATVYVGGWRDGKKEGRGVCYDASGKVVLKGKFVKDKLSESLSAGAESQCFVIKDIGNTVYVGEMKGDKQDGFGLTLTEKGEFVFGNTSNGVRQGIGMRFYSQNTWEVGKWTDGEFSAFKNSEAEKRTIAYNKEAARQTRDQLLNALGYFAQAGMTAATMVNEIKGGSSANGNGDALDGSTLSSSKKSKGSKKKSSASSDCKHCSGTGICPYCNGDGYNYAVGNPVQCTACKGHIGRCKWCNK